MTKKIKVILLQVSAWCAGFAFEVLGSAGATTAGLVLMLASLAFAGAAYVFHLSKI